VEPALPLLLRLSQSQAAECTGWAFHWAYDRKKGLSPYWARQVTKVASRPTGGTAGNSSNSRMGLAFFRFVDLQSCKSTAWIVQREALSIPVPHNSATADTTSMLAKVKPVAGSPLRIRAGGNADLGPRVIRWPSECACCLQSVPALASVPASSHQLSILTRLRPGSQEPTGNRRILSL
jgi:hypothetical protein